MISDIDDNFDVRPSIISITSHDDASNKEQKRESSRHGEGLKGSFIVSVTHFFFSSIPRVEKRRIITKIKRVVVIESSSFVTISTIKCVNSRHSLSYLIPYHRRIRAGDLRDLFFLTEFRSQTLAQGEDRSGGSFIVKSR